jgi:hypothetical protein
MMKTKLVTILAVAVMLLVTVAMVIVAQDALVEGESAGTASLDKVAWFIDTIDGDASNDMGQHASVAIDPSDGTIYVSYYDATNGDLRWARTVPAGGNCGPDNAWYCDTVASLGNVGQYSSIAVHTGAGPADWKVGIAYYDAGGGHLRYAEYTYNLYNVGENGTVTGGGGSWAYSTIDTGNPSLYSYKGRYTSLVFGSDGTAHISYQHYNVLGDDSLKYAHYVGSGGNCGSGLASGQWQCDTIHTGNGEGQYTAIALYGPDRPHIVFHDGGNSRLRYAVYNPSYTSGCSTGITGWVCSEIDSAVAGPISADADPATGSMHIAYVTTGNKLKHAAPVASGGNCGPGNTWFCRQIDDMGTSVDSRGISLAIDDAGYPVIAYQQVSLAPESLESLKMARPGAAPAILSSSVALNCGIDGSFLPTWYCETVDAAGYSEQNGDYASVTVSPAGLVTVAYYEQDALNSTGYLQVAYQRFPAFLPLVLRNH